MVCCGCCCNCTSPPLLVLFCDVMVDEIIVAAVDSCTTAVGILCTLIISLIGWGTVGQQQKNVKEYLIL